MEGEVVCVATHIRLRHPLLIPAFLWFSARAAIAARRTPGNIRVRLLGFPPLRSFRTLTVWESDAAVNTFVATPQHVRAMAQMGRFARVGKFVRFRSEKRRVGWRTAFRELRKMPMSWPPMATAREPSAG